MEEYAREPCPWRIIDDSGGKVQKNPSARMTSFFHDMVFNAFQEHSHSAFWEAVSSVQFRALEMPQLDLGGERSVALSDSKKKDLCLVSQLCSDDMFLPAIKLVRLFYIRDIRNKTAHKG